MKIISVKKRNWLARLFSVKHWKVVVEDRNGKQIAVHAWAGVHEPRADNLLHYVKRAFEDGEDMEDIVGREF